MTAFCIALLLALPPGLASAQRPSTVEAQPNKLPTVFVVETNGVESQGKLLRLGAREVVLLIVGKEQKFDLEHVQKVQQKKRSFAQSAVVGAIVGVGSVLLPTAICKGLLGDCDRWPLYALGGGALGGAIGGVLGMLIPQRAMLYERPKPAKVPPSRATGIAIQLRWN